MLEGFGRITKGGCNRVGNVCGSGGFLCFFWGEGGSGGGVNYDWRTLECISNIWR